MQQKGFVSIDFGESAPLARAAFYFRATLLARTELPKNSAAEREAMPTEKRWFQKPEFLFTIFVFVFLQSITFWRSSVNQAKADTDQRRDFEEFRRNQDSFNKGLLDRMKSFEDRQAEVLRAWNTEHDGVNALGGLLGTLRKEYDSFVVRHDEDERTQNAYQTNTRERVIKLEAKQP